MPNLGKRHARVFQTVSLPYSANMLNSSWFFFLTSNIFLVYHPINIIGFLCTCLSDLHSYFIKETFFSSSSLKFKNLFNNYTIDYWFLSEKYDSSKCLKEAEIILEYMYVLYEIHFKDENIILNFKFYSTL